jgi:hypothetical protein
MRQKRRETLASSLEKETFRENSRGSTKGRVKCSAIMKVHNPKNLLQRRARESKLHRSIKAEEKSAGSNASDYFRGDSIVNFARNVFS